LQADRIEQFLERLAHVAIIIDNEYGGHILRAHNSAPQSKGKSKSKCRELRSVVVDQSPVENAG
jgi:hypothetical protein